MAGAARKGRVLHGPARPGPVRRGLAWQAAKVRLVLERSGVVLHGADSLGNAGAANFGRDGPGTAGPGLVRYGT